MTERNYDNYKAVGAWFLGPKGENEEELLKMIARQLSIHCAWRRSYFPQDAPYVTAANVKVSREYIGQMARLRESAEEIAFQLRNSQPFFSSRYKGHMNWDVSLPSILGYFAAMLYNPNNLATEGSPYTTELERQVGEQLCEMIGYKVPATASSNDSEPLAWGHITADGTISNVESLWAARNVRYHGLAIQRALLAEPSLASARDITVVPVNGSQAVKLVDMEKWACTNLSLDSVMNIILRLQTDFALSANVIQAALSKYDVQNVGLGPFNGENAGVYFVPATRHYSWDKAGALLGMGTNQMRMIDVDGLGRMKVDDLEAELKNCAAKHIPVIQVVAVIGTTSQGAVDDIDGIWRLRRKMRSEYGLDFYLHADAAWGGYFRSMLISMMKAVPGYVPSLPLSDYTRKQLQHLSFADSVTIDPHKSGFVQYPAGSLSYKNNAVRHLLAFTAPVIYNGATDPSMGIFGIEGSKPGAAVVATYLSHTTIGLNDTGYGQLLGQANFTCKVIWAELVTLAARNDADPFRIVTLQQEPTEEQWNFIKQSIIGQANSNIRDVALKYLTESGPDLLINAFSVNFSLPILLTEPGQKRKINTDMTRLNEFMEALSADMNISDGIQQRRTTGVGRVARKHLFMIRSEFDERFSTTITRFKKSLGIEEKPEDKNRKLIHLVNSNMDPWPTATNCFPTLRAELRKSILRCIGQVTDHDVPEEKMKNEEWAHGFVLLPTEDEYVYYADHLPMFNMIPHQYHVIAKFRFTRATVAKINATEKVGVLLAGNKPTARQTLHELLYGPEHTFIGDVFNGTPSPENSVDGEASIQVIDLIRLDHFDPATLHPANPSYFMYGHGTHAYLSHNISTFPDYHECIKFEVPPELREIITPGLLQYGINVTFSDIKVPKYSVGMTTPLNSDAPYKIEFIGENGDPKTVHIAFKPENFIWFDSQDLNMPPHPAHDHSHSAPSASHSKL